MSSPGKRYARWLLDHDGDECRAVYEGCTDEEIIEMMDEEVWANPSDAIEGIECWVMERPDDEELARIYGLACVYE